MSGYPVAPIDANSTRTMKAPSTRITVLAMQVGIWDGCSRLMATVLCVVLLVLSVDVVRRCGGAPHVHLDVPTITHKKTTRRDLVMRRQWPRQKASQRQ